MIISIVVAVYEKPPKSQQKLDEGNLIDILIKNLQFSMGLGEENRKSFYLIEKKNFLAGA